MLTNPGARAEAEDHLVVQAARRAEIHILDRGGIAQLRVSQAREAPVLARGPFRIDQQAEAVVKTQLGVRARSALLLKATAIAISRRVWSFSIVGCVSISLLVVDATAHILVRQRRTCRGRILERQPVLLIDENLFDGAKAIGAQPLGARAGRFQPIRAVQPPESHQAEAGAVALFGMRLALENARHDPAGRRAGLRPGDRARRRPFRMRAMRAGQVRHLGGKRPRPVSRADASRHTGP